MGVWDSLALDTPPRRIPLPPDEDSNLYMFDLAFNPSSTRLATAHPQHLHVWDIITGASVAVLKAHTQEIYSVVFSPDGRYVLSASSDGTAKVWFAESGECTQSLEGHEDPLTQALFSPDGRYIATASADETVRLWRAEDGSCLATSNYHEYRVLSGWADAGIGRC